MVQSTAAPAPLTGAMCLGSSGGMAWSTEERDALKAAIASGALEVEYDGPPRRRVRYQDLAAMRDLLAEMNAELGDSPRYRRVRLSRGFR